MTTVNVGPGQLDLGGLTHGRPHSLAITVTGYTPSSASLVAYDATGSTVATIGGTITTGTITLDLTSYAALAAGFYTHELVVDSASWLKGSARVQADGDGKGQGSSRTAAVAVSNGSATVTLAVTAIVSGDATAAKKTANLSDLASPSTALANLGGATSAALTSEVARAIAAESAITAAVAAGYQPLDSDLTAIAALSTTTYGRSLLALADDAAGRTALALGTAATQALSAFDAAGAAATAQAAAMAASAQRASNLSDLASASTARTNLGLGTAATRNTGSTSSDVATGDEPKLVTHAALTSGVHGITRSLVTFTAVTPPQISGNLLSQAEQSFASGWTAGTGATSLVLAVAGGGDGGGTATLTVNGASGDGCYTAAKTVIAASTYTASMRCLFADTVGLRIDWYSDAGGTALISSTVGSAVASGSKHVTILATGIAPGGAVSARLVLVYASSAAARVANPSVACIRTSATIPGSSSVAQISPAGAACVALSGTAAIVTHGDAAGGTVDLTFSTVAGALTHVGLDFIPLTANRSFSCYIKDAYWLTPPALQGVTYGRVPLAYRFVAQNGGSMVFEVNGVGCVNGDQVKLSGLFTEVCT